MAGRGPCLSCTEGWRPTGWRGIARRPGEGRALRLVSAVQLSTLEAEQDYLAMRVRQEHAACRVVAAHLANLTSMLTQNQVPPAVSPVFQALVHWRAHASAAPHVGNLCGVAGLEYIRNAIAAGRKLEPACSSG